MEIEQLEALALSDDRDAALAQLVPGTDDHAYWTAIRHQHRGELDAVDELLARWRARRGSTERLQRIERRQRILRADRDLPSHADELARAMDVKTDHAREVEHEATRPTTLPADLLLAERVLDRGMRRRQADGLTNHALPELLAGAKGDLGKEVRRAVLERLERTGVPGLVEALARHLEDHPDEGFGSLPAQHLLTLDEIDELAYRRPEVRTSEAWVLARIQRMVPPDHVDLHLDDLALSGFLDDVWAFVDELPPAFNSLKAHVLYHRLRCDERAGVVDRDRLLRYLALPRRAPYVADTLLEGLQRPDIANLRLGFALGLGGPVGDDERLVRALVGALLEREGPEAVEPFVDERWLDVLLAETRLLAGDPADRWTHVLGPGAATALRERVDIDVLPTTPRRFGEHDSVHVDVALKNCWPLRIRVFRINVAVTGGDVARDIDLDGLSASAEVIREASAPAMHRVRERIELRECERPGTYVVELIGNGRASRAVIRKGALYAVPRRSAAGLSVTIVDEDGGARPEATLRLGEQEFEPRTDGTITIPFGTGSQGHRKALLCDGDLVSSAELVLPREEYALSTDVLLDRQSLVAGGTATAVVRVDLRVGGSPVPVSLLGDVYVEITTVDRLGVPATRRRPVTLTDHRELEVSIAVPEHLATLTIAVGGEVRVVSEQRTLSLRDEVTTEVGTMHGASSTFAAYLVRSTTGFGLRLIGKGGEARAGRAVSLRLEHDLLVQPIDVVLATDEQGEIQLGELPGVHALSVDLPAADAGRPVTQRFSLREFDSGSPPQEVVVVEGEEVSVPLGFGDATLGWQLVELRGAAAVADHSGSATVVAGVLRVDPPAPGTYQLRGSDGPIVKIVVLPAASSVAGGWARSRDRLRERTAPGAVLQSASVTPEGLVIEVSRPGPTTRVCVLPTPFWPSLAWSSTLAPGPREGEVRYAWIRQTESLSGRDIGDEYRYVLDRRDRPRRPGTMLERPGLLLNPFALRTTRTTSQTAREGQEWGGVAGGSAFAESAPESEEDYRTLAAAHGGRLDPAFAAFDFLVHSPTPLVNRIPDASGRLVVPASALAGASVVRVLCIDSSASTAATVALSATPVAVRDGRLSAALPADSHLREVRVLEPLTADDPLLVEGHGAPRYEVVGTVDVLYRALCALSGDADLATWTFLPRWSELDRAERLERYSQHACHELSLFVRFKDPELFDEVVAPYLRNKLHPTFVDRFLLGEDLSGYLEPAALRRLNAIEVALLARSLPPDSRARAALVRRLADATDVRSPTADRARDDLLVEILLAGGVSGDDEPPDELVASEPRPPSAPRLAKAAVRGPGGPARLRQRRSLPSDDGGAGNVSRDLADREEQSPLYRGVDKTREWAEHNWWHQRNPEQNAALVAPARLWRDLAAHVEGPFLSPFLADAGERFATAVVALAVTDLPFTAGETRTASDPRGLVLHTTTPALVARRTLARVPGDATGEALVGQSTYRSDDRWEWDGAERREKPVTGELRTGIRYEDEVVVSNPTSRSQVLDVLVQIPAGAMPVGGSTASRTHRVELQAYETKTLTTPYYFPAPGRFEQYGTRITRGDVLVASADARTFTVSRDPAVSDPDAWPHLSQHGSLEDVVRFLAARNLHRVDLTKIAWRMGDRAAFEQVTATLADRLVFDPVLWGYALLHHDRTRLGEWLSMREGLATEVGPLACDLVTLDPRDGGHFQHLEYSPLVNARTHALGERRQVLNEGLATQWRALLDRMATLRAPGSEEWLAAVQALLTMERSDEAEPLLHHVATDGPAPLQQAYLRAWLAISAGDLEAARELVTPYADQPVPRWRARIRSLLALLDEVEGRPPVDGGLDPSLVRDDREARMSDLAARQPTLTAAIERRSLQLDHVNVERIEVRAYPMDVELLFSRQPFLDAAEERFLRVEPATVTALSASPTGRTEVPVADVLPDAVEARNALLEVVAGPLRRVVTWFDNDLLVMVASAAGRVSVRRASDRRPLAAAYVKAYAKHQDGQVAFYKDGYTDLRGWFDFATLSTDDLDRVTRFALLVAHDDAGVSVLEAEPPTR